MEDKIKWFGIYPKEAVQVDGETYPGSMSKIDFINNKVYIDYGVGDYAFCVSKCKLILKEIEDITEEDAKECIRIGYYGYLNPEITNRTKYGFEFTFQYASSKRRRGSNYSIGYGARMEWDQIDFLRSKGYAIGIPKEYYINEKELKNGKS